MHLDDLSLVVHHSRCTKENSGGLLRNVNLVIGRCELGQIVRQKKGSIGIKLDSRKFNSTECSLKSGLLCFKNSLFISPLTYQMVDNTSRAVTLYR